MFKIIIKENYEELSRAANELFRRLLTQNPEAVIGLATGSSPLGLYREMAADCKNGLTDYSFCTSFNLDEYIGLAPDHPESYRAFMFRNLFSLINIDPEKINIPQAIGSADLAACAAYEELLREKQIDLQLLGIGSNAHIGFNEPGSSFASRTHIVELAKRTRLDNQRFFASLDEVPTHAITMGIANILDAKTIVLLASGQNKVQAVYDMINGPVTEEVPASILQKHPDVVVILDEEAAAKL